MLWLFDRKGKYKVVVDENSIAVILMNYKLWRAKKTVAEAVKEAMKAIDLNEEIPTSFYAVTQDYVILGFNSRHSPRGYKHVKNADFRDITKEIEEYKKHHPELTTPVIIAPDDLIEKSPFIGIHYFLEGLFREYMKRSSEVSIPSPLQKSLQPLNITKTKERNITHLTLEQSYKELLEKNPKAFEELKKFLNEEHELLLPPISTVHEQMFIDIIAQLLRSEPKARFIRIYIKPKNFNDFHDGILVIGREKLVEKFKLTDEEFKKIFVGRKREPAAVDRLNNKPFAIRNSYGELTLSNLINATRFKSSSLHFIEIKTHPVFRNFSKGFVRDNLWKLRKIKEEVNPKAQKPLLNLRNKLITLDKTLTVSYRTLAEWAGLASRKRREWSLLKEQINEYLEYLQRLHDIDFRIEGENVKIWKPE